MSKYIKEHIQSKHFWLGFLQIFIPWLYSLIIITIGTIIGKYFGFDTSLKTWTFYYFYMLVLIGIPFGVGGRFLKYVERKMLNSDKAS